jgi:hypothetical protein
VPFWGVAEARNRAAARYRLLSRVLLEAGTAGLGLEVDWTRGFAVVEAWPVHGASLDGTVAELLDASAMPVEGADGPFYIDAAGDRLPDPEATASIGPNVFAGWMNLAPGQHFARLTGSDGEPLLDRCGLLESGWERTLNGERVLEMEVFAGVGSNAIDRECAP